MRILAALLIGCIVSGCIISWCIVGGTAHAEMDALGGWMLDIRIDPSTRQANVGVLRENDNHDNLALRCLRGSLSIAVSPNGAVLEDGDIYEVALRVDQGEVFKMNGSVVGNDLIEFNDQMSDVIRQIRQGHQLLVRTVGASTYSMIFSLADVTKVIGPLLKACPLNEAPSTAVPL